MIITLLQEKYPGSLQTKKDISNIKKQIHHEVLHYQTITSAVLTRLERDGFFYKFVLDEEQRLQSLFFAYNESIKLYEQFHHVILMDCTYETNKYNLPALNICTVTGSNKTITVGLCLLPGETEDHFYWAL